MNDFWIPDRRWEGQDVFVLGGGPSLRDFDFSRLSGKTVLGCNEAYTLGYPTVTAIFFSDAKWFVRRNRELEEYTSKGGFLVTHDEPLRNHNLPWLKVLCRLDGELRGMRTMKNGQVGHGIGFGHNSGSSSINLALLLGARRVYLLGFDMKQSGDRKNNWHQNYVKYHRPNYVPPFHRFLIGM